MKCSQSMLLLCLMIFPAVQTASQSAYHGPYIGQNPPGNEPVLFAPGFISKPGRFEFSGSFSPDGTEFYFTVSNRDWTENRILCTKLEHDTWSEPSVLPISGFDVDWSVYLSNDGKRLFFGSGRPLQSWTLDVWMSERVESAWSDPVKMNINTPRSDFPGTTTRNGTLYFASRFEGKGSIGVFKSELIDNEYLTAEKLPYPINTDNERDGGPFISPDESFLLFSSIREGSSGSDIYISFGDIDGSWMEPLNLGVVINTDKQEGTPFLSPDGAYLFFTRDDGPNDPNREIDIYWVSSEVIQQVKDSQQ